MATRPAGPAGVRRVYEGKQTNMGKGGSGVWRAQASTRGRAGAEHWRVGVQGKSDRIQCRLPGCLLGWYAEHAAQNRLSRQRGGSKKGRCVRENLGVADHGFEAGGSLVQSAVWQFGWGISGPANGQRSVKGGLLGSCVGAACGVWQLRSRKRGAAGAGAGAGLAGAVPAPAPTCGPGSSCGRRSARLRS